jgi:hypothetical protein
VVKKKEVEKVRNPYPSSAMQKLRLRLMTARKSNKLDLSTKCCWPELAGEQPQETKVEAAAIPESDSVAESKSEAPGRASAKDEIISSSGAPAAAPNENEPSDKAQDKQADGAVFLTETNPLEPTDNQSKSDEQADPNNEQAVAAAVETAMGIQMLDEEEQADAAKSKSLKTKEGSNSKSSKNETVSVSELAAESLLSQSQRKRLKPITLNEIANIRKGKDLLELSPIELLNCLRDPGHKHELLSSQISIPSIDFMLYTVPESAFKMATLSELWLTNNSITSLPTSISDLKQLKILCVAGNRLKSLPSELCSLDSLQVLYVHRNSLRELPEEFDKLQAIKTINMSYNDFPVFPETICKLINLEFLDISCNHLADLPSPAFKKLKNLNILHVGSNPPMKTAPKILMQMKWVDVSGCPPVSSTAENGESKSEVLESHTLGESYEDLELFLRSRASSRITAKLRRRNRSKSKDAKQAIAAAIAAAPSK